MICGNALYELRKLESESIDVVVTDPPYGYSFMNKDWDKAVIGVETWRECLRVLKPGSFAAIMSSPRQDVLARMIVNLQDAGFRTDFTSIYWTYASGFPKAANISKLVDKRNGLSRDWINVAQYLKEQRLKKNVSLDKINQAVNGKLKAQYYESVNQEFNRIPIKADYLILKSILDLDNRFDELIEREEAEREIIGKGVAGLGKNDKPAHEGGYKQDYNITKSATEKAKELDGSYAGFQPKPAVEVILIVMKPLSEKTYVDQALANGKGISWLDSVRIPFQDDDDPGIRTDYTNLGISHAQKDGGRPWINERIDKGLPVKEYEPNNKGRFPANLLVSDDILNDGKITKSSPVSFQNTPLLERSKGWNKHNMKRMPPSGYSDSGSYSRYFDLDKWFETTFPFIITPKASSKEKGEYNKHATVKPIKLMSWLITLLSREGDIILDPFCGSGTTLLVAKMLNRKYIGIDINQEYVDISKKRIMELEKKN
jgi:DNA modification methylase